MIAYVPYEAAYDAHLTPTALRLLVYLGGEHEHSKKWKNYWCWESLGEIALHLSTQYFHYSPKMIKDALYLLRKNGYLERAVRLILPSQEGRRAVRHRCYRLIISLDDQYACSTSIQEQKRA